MRAFQAALNLRCPKVSHWYAFGFVLFVHFILLSFGNPQWHRWVFMYQVFVIHDHSDRFLVPAKQDWLALCSGDAPEALPSRYTGVWKVWNEDGEIHRYTTYRNGMMHGLDYGWSGSGTFWADSIAWYGHYRHGLRSGLHIVRDLRGSMLIGNYIRGREHGRFQCLDRNGGSRIIYYNNGKPVKPDMAAQVQPVDR